MVNDLSFRLSTSSLFDRWDASKQNISSSYTESAYYLVTQASSSKSTVLKLSANSKDSKARGGFLDVQKYLASGTAKLVAFHTEFLTRFNLLVSFSYIQFHLNFFSAPL